MYEIICDGCGEVIPEGRNFIEDGNLCFCDDECEGVYYINEGKY